VKRNCTCDSLTLGPGPVFLRQNQFSSRQGTLFPCRGMPFCQVVFIFNEVSNPFHRFWLQFFVDWLPRPRASALVRFRVSSWRKFLIPDLYIVDSNLFSALPGLRMCSCSNPFLCLYFNYQYVWFFLPPGSQENIFFTKPSFPPPTTTSTLASFCLFPIPTLVPPPFRKDSFLPPSQREKYLHSPLLACVESIRDTPLHSCPSVPVSNFGPSPS